MPTISTLGQVREFPWEADARRMAMQRAMQEAQWGRQDALYNRDMSERKSAADRAYELGMAQLKQRGEDSAADRAWREAQAKAEGDYRKEQIGLMREQMQQNRPRTPEEIAAAYASYNKSGMFGTPQDSMVMGENPAMEYAKGAVSSPMGQAMLGPLAGTAAKALALAQQTNAAPALTAPKLDLDASIEKAILGQSRPSLRGVDPRTLAPILGEDNSLARLTALAQLREGREERGFNRWQRQREMAKAKTEANVEDTGIDEQIALAQAQGDAPLVAQLMAKRAGLRGQAGLAAQLAAPKRPTSKWLESAGGAVVNEALAGLMDDPSAATFVSRDIRQRMGLTPMSEQETALRDAISDLVDRAREEGIDDTQVKQQVYDLASKRLARSKKVGKGAGLWADRAMMKVREILADLVPGNAPGMSSLDLPAPER